jgi:Tfp pilus assembly protein PilF
VAPRFARAHYSLALVLDSMRDRAGARRELTIAVEDDPTYIDAHLALGDMLRRERRFDDALNEYRSALRLDPGSSVGALGQAMVLGDTTQYRDALQVLERAAEAQSGVPELVQARARLLAAAPDAGVRDGQRALALMNANLPHEPRTLGLAETMAMAAAETGQYGEALTWQRQAVAAGVRGGLSSIVERLQRVLAGYERNQPCRSPWSLDEDLRLLQSVPLQ